MNKFIKIFLAFCLAFSNLALAQTDIKTNQLMDKKWKEVDSLVNKVRKPESAKKVVQSILELAIKNKEADQKIKAEAWLIALDAKEDDADIIQISSYLSKVGLAEDEIEKAIWQNRAAGSLNEYYSKHRWQILKRTSLEDESNIEIATWDAQRFHKKIRELFLSSIEQRTKLRSTPISNYKAIISEGVNTPGLRTSIYDMLVTDAIDYFESGRNESTNPLLNFSLDKINYFIDVQNFINYSISTKDSSSLKYNALKLYQEALKFYLVSKNTNALIDLDMKRLLFIYQNSTLENKDSLYENALRQLANVNKENPLAGGALFAAIQNNYEKGNRTNYRGGDDYYNEVNKKKYDYVSYVKNLKYIVDTYPNSRYAIDAENAIRLMKAVNLSIELEEAYLPNENIKLQLSYNNVRKVKLSVYETNLLQAKNENYKGTLIKTWNQTLVNSEDLAKHSVELKVDPLPIGLYKIEIEDEKSKINVEQLLQVTNLSAARTNADDADKAWLILNRKDGKIVPSPTLIYLDYIYDKKIESQFGIIKASKQGTKDGNLRLIHRFPKEDLRFSITKDNDTFLFKDNIGGYQFRWNDRKFDDYDEDEDEYTKAFIFTDRSIYRPGQTVYFKAIFVDNFGNKKNKVVVNKLVEVTLDDVNSQEIKKLTLKTNEFGSIAGSFIIPETGLTGRMSIETDYGYCSFQVEEYKRPKFYVTFDTLKAKTKLDEKVTVSGNALSYAGSNIDNAKVKYRVVRNTSFPFPWLCDFKVPSVPEVEIIHGETTTDAAGKFSIDFTAFPDKSIISSALPIFRYTVYVDITDLNGENRSEEKRVNVGYHDLDLSIYVNEKNLASQFYFFYVKTENLNGIFSETDLIVKIVSLQKADRLYRDRLWDEPSDHVYSEAEFKALFPNDCYKNEWEPENRAKISTIWSKDLKSRKDGFIEFPKDLFKTSGYYEIIVTGTDKLGKKSENKKYVFVYVSSDKQQFDKPLFIRFDENLYKPGDKLTLFVDPAYKNANLLQFNTKGKSLSIKNNKAEFNVTEKDRGGFSSSWFYVYNNRTYKAEESASVPWSNKDLYITWASHRNKLIPGTQEEWTLTVAGKNKDKVASELVAGLYDASLDAIKRHEWDWRKLYTYNNSISSWNAIGFDETNSQTIQAVEYKLQLERKYATWNLNPFFVDNMGTTVYGQKLDSRTYAGAVSSISAKEIERRPIVAQFDLSSSESDVETSGTLVYGTKVEKRNELIYQDSSNIRNGNTFPTSNIRTNLQETAFFLPQLKTDENGNIVFKFTIPEALTEWKFMAFAHTPDWKTGYLEGKVQTQKDLMVFPNLPRFLRQGDKMTLATKISNLSPDALKGKAKISILDAKTGQSLNLKFGFREAEVAFSVAGNQSSVVNFEINVPLAQFDPVIVRIVATAGDFSDGEEQMLPVLSNRMLVTETLPFSIYESGTTEFKLDKLLQSKSSSTLLNKSLSLEFTANPAWYAVQALPYLMEFPYECSEQIYNRFYANALASHIVEQQPRLKKVFEQWKNSDTSALLSNLEKNQVLKSALLEETPWVLDAQNETQQHLQIARLFETHKLAKGLNEALSKLKKMQNDDGSFSWFPGMGNSRYITQYIMTGLAKLQAMNVTAAQGKEVKRILDNGLVYLDAQIDKDYKNIKKENRIKDNLNAENIQYLYLRSFLKTAVNDNYKDAYDYYLKQSASFWNTNTNYSQAMIALVQHRAGNTKVATSIMESLSERAIKSKEMGMYWKQNFNYSWNDLPIESQALLLTAFNEITKDEKTVDQLKLWLLRQKQTQDWGTTTATADACYALLTTGSDWLQPEKNVTINLGAMTIRSAEEAGSAGSGYFKKIIEGKDVKPEMGNLSVNWEGEKGNQNSGLSWGAIYWQYFENIDKITASETGTPLHIEKELYLETNTDKGKALKKITAESPLKVGDKVVVRIIIKADRAMEFVHLKDSRAAGFEPVNVLSGYKWNNGLGYYESTKDIATHFFFDYLPKGTFVFDYPLMVNQKGTFSNGIATMQCMYAPEFSSHSEGISVEVK